MDHIAHTLNKDPLVVRQVNFLERGDQLMGMEGEQTFEFDNIMPLLVEEMKISGEYEQRRAAINKYNTVRSHVSNFKYPRTR